MTTNNELPSIEFLFNLAQEIHADNVKMGWWPEDACILTKLMLTITELSEAVEGDRKNLQDDKLPHRPMREVELADAMIRLLDIGGRLEFMPDFDVVEVQSNIEIRKELRLPLSNEPVPFAVDCLLLSSRVTDLAKDFTDNDWEEMVMDYSLAVFDIIQTAQDYDLDLWGALEEKRAFNAIREDHKLENREKENGKSY